MKKITLIIKDDETGEVLLNVGVHSYSCNFKYPGRDVHLGPNGFVTEHIASNVMVDLSVGGELRDPEENTQPKECAHEWKEVQGLIETWHVCEKCGDSDPDI